MTDRHCIDSYKLKNVIVDPQLSTIGGAKVEPKAMQLLGLLVEKQGSLCLKKEIIDELWPRQIIGDDVITKLVFVLRQALGDDAKSPIFISTITKRGYVLMVPAKPLKTISFSIVVLSTLPVLLMFAWMFWPSASTSLHYEVIRSKPITHKEGVTYDYALGEHFDGYFYQREGNTQLIISHPNNTEQVAISDKWQKRSLEIVGNTLFYIRFNLAKYQIVKHRLGEAIKVLVERDKAIYSLAFDEDKQALVFNQYEHNASTVLQQYSFISDTVQRYSMPKGISVDKIYQPYFHSRLNTLYFVGVDGQTPTIYGLKNDQITGKINGFSKVTAISSGIHIDNLLVAGTYRQMQGIWSVSLKSNVIMPVYSHAGSEVTDMTFDAAQKLIYYSFLESRVDLKEVSLDGEVNVFSMLNSTLMETTARYSSDSKSIYFISNRRGDFELYGYNIHSKQVSQLSTLQANSIRYYSISNDNRYAAIVYSKELIYLGVIELESGRLIRSVALDDVKYPLAWSNDGRYIYVSEHKKNVALYLYDALNLNIVDVSQKKGLVAYEVADKEVITFDYLSSRFVLYDFKTKQNRFLSEPVSNHGILSPDNAYADSGYAVLSYQDGIQKVISQYTLSNVASKRKQVILGQWSSSGNVQSYSVDRRSTLLSDRGNITNGNVVALQIK
nr:winged helix-turn-helix domain-containing protein [Pseudoalteromonas caenipelagi]